MAVPLCPAEPGLTVIRVMPPAGPGPGPGRRRRRTARNLMPLAAEFRDAWARRACHWQAAETLPVVHWQSDGSLSLSLVLLVTGTAATVTH